MGITTHTEREEEEEGRDLPVKKIGATCYEIQDIVTFGDNFGRTSTIQWDRLGRHTHLGRFDKDIHIGISNRFDVSL